MSPQCLTHTNTRTQACTHFGTSLRLPGDTVLRCLHQRLSGARDMRWASTTARSRRSAINGFPGCGSELCDGACMWLENEVQRVHRTLCFVWFNDSWFAREGAVFNSERSENEAAVEYAKLRPLCANLHRTKHFVLPLFGSEYVALVLKQQ